VPPPPTDLGWARAEPVRSIRWLIRRALLLPFTEAMVHPKVEGREWVRELELPVIFAANHSSHADTSLILHSLTDSARDRTVVAAAADYPEGSDAGSPIRGLADALEAGGLVFHAGTALRGGELVTNGGRILDVTGLGPTLSAARTRAYDALGKISFEGMRYRRDIAALAAGVGT